MKNSKLLSTVRLTSDCCYKIKPCSITLVPLLSPWHCPHWGDWKRKYGQEAQLSPRDRAMRRVNWNLANCHATVQKLLIAKFHYTDPTGPGSPTESAHVVEYELNSTTRTRPDPHGPNGVSSQKKSVRVRSGPCRVRVVEFSSYPTTCADFVRDRTVSGPCRVRVGFVSVSV